MAEHKETSTENAASKTAGRPEVILEILFDRGLFMIAVNNIGNRPALDTSVKFNQKIIGLGGTKEISALRLFRNIPFLGPRRQITTLLDRSDSYFQAKQPTAISARVTYADAEGRRYEAVISHDLEIYRELAYVASDSNESCYQSPEVSISHGDES